MISAEVLLRLGRVGVKPRKLELKRRIEEDAARISLSPSGIRQFAVKTIAE